jgi:photoactive yellow protein
VHLLDFRTEDAEIFELSREALDALPFGIITLDRSGTILRYNLAEETLARRRSVRSVGLNFFSDVAPCTNVQAFRGRFDAFAQSYESGSERFTFSFAFRWGRQDVSITMLRKAGFEEINILVRGRSTASLPGTDGERLTDAGVAAAFVDTPKALAAVSDVKMLAPPRICALDPLTAADPRFLCERVHPDDVAAVGLVITHALRDCVPYAVEYRGSADLDRRIFQEHGNFGPHPAQAGQATIVDVTEQRQFAADVWRAAHYDPLTGLPNQKLLLLRIEDAVREAAVDGRITAIVLANIVNFRSVNDTFGHARGNELLRAIGMRLGECVRGGDTVARITGDWFVVLLTDVDTPSSVTDAATRMIAAAAQPFEIDGRSHYLTLRAGVSLAPYDGHDPQALLIAAETAIYSARTSGRSGLRFYSNQLALDAASSLELQNELRDGLENRQFELAYQPLIDIESGRVVAVEALARWNHPVRGFVSPLDFIPLADSSGLIVPLGEWVLRTACGQARAWADRGIDVRVCVNVSTVQFARPNFVDLVATVLADSHLPAERLELELTESIMVDGFGDMIETLTRLKSLGLRLAIDDFGTGYSSLSYLKYFPVDTLKIDRAFITDIVADKFDHAIATAIFTLAERLALECIVEGVETAEQLDALRAIGCRLVQGFYFSRPLPADELAARFFGPLMHADLL